MICVRISLLHLDPLLNLLYIAHVISPALLYSPLLSTGVVLRAIFFQGVLFEAFLAAPQWHNGPSV